MSIFRRKDNQTTAGGAATLPPPQTGSKVINDFGQALATALPRDKLPLLNVPPQRRLDAPTQPEEFYGYQILNWLIRSWVPPWIPIDGIPDEKVAEMMRNLKHNLSVGEPIHDMTTAADAGYGVEWINHYIEAGQNQANDMRANHPLSKLIADVAQANVDEAMQTSGGEAALAVASSSVPDACEATKIMHLDGPRWATFGASADEGIDAFDRVKGQLSPDPDIARLSLKNFVGAKVSIRLHPTVESLQDSVIGLYRELLDA
jgi:hypothetical protein